MTGTDGRRGEGAQRGHFERTRPLHACLVGCTGGACETCPCCSAGWCVFGLDGLPEDADDFAAWLEIAAEHNALAARFVALVRADHGITS